MKAIDAAAAFVLIAFYLLGTSVSVGLLTYALIRMGEAP